MADTTMNLPLVIQQSGDVSRLQAVAQHAGEQQQRNAVAEALRRQAHEASSVQGTEAVASQNRISSEEHGDSGPRQQARQGGQPGKRKRQADHDPEDGGTVLDLVV